MSIQDRLNNHALSFVPKIKNIIDNAPAFEANQMRHYTLREMAQTDIPVSFMLQKPLDNFQNELIEVFKHNDWIK